MMSKSEDKKLTRRYERGMKHGWSDVVIFRLLPEFVVWMSRQGWNIREPCGDELLVFEQDGHYTRIWWNEKLRRCCTDRTGMCRWIVFEGHFKR